MSQSIFLKVQIHVMQNSHNPKFIMRSSPSYVAYNYTSNEVAVCTQELQQTISSMKKKMVTKLLIASTESDEYEMTYVANRTYRAIKVTHLHQITSSAQSYAPKLNLIIHMPRMHIRTPTHKIMQARDTKETSQMQDEHDEMLPTCFNLGHGHELNYYTANHNYHQGGALAIIY
jgi:hypothetical protein